MPVLECIKGSVVCSNVLTRDIWIVMRETQCNYEVAAAALAKHKGDIVEAIIEITVI